MFSETASFLKIGRGGYDGRGQARLGFDKPATADDLAKAWRDLGSKPCVAEQALDLDFEISVMAAHSPSGEVRSFPAARNHHENQILASSVLPAGISTELEARAEAIASSIIERLGLEGLLCIEMFVTRQGELLVNELAPRPHNSYHQSERGCVTSQFEQLVRAVCDLPLGDTTLVTPAAIVNLLGEVWLDGTPKLRCRAGHPPAFVYIYMKNILRAPAARWATYLRQRIQRYEALQRALDAYKALHQ